ncbi:hypothetical protein J6590_087066 [Homalodisca vitripennis]|nr:hypothetical protein J6590_087066 [Homalodisca vitripennis]
MEINGERHPSEVYTDFRSAVLRFLGSQDKTAVAAPNGTAITVAPTTTASVYKPPGKGYPPVIWIIGGPGSNKSSLSQKAVRHASGWVSLSVGRLLRAAAETSEGAASEDAQDIRKAIVAGEMVEQDVVLQLVETQLNTNMNVQGILLDGFPRDINQVHKFEDKFNQQPKLILLDCSKLQLGRGRLDDSIAAFRKRLELFREMTLPMLKTLDNESRLSIVDGDTDSPQVQEEFTRMVLQQIDYLKNADGLIVPEPVIPNGSITHHNGNHIANHVTNHVVNHTANHVSNGYPDTTTVLDLEEGDEPTPVHMNGYGPTRPTISDIGRTMDSYHQRTEQNGGLFGGPTIPNRPSRETIRNMYAQVDRYPMDSNI